MFLTKSSAFIIAIFAISAALGFGEVGERCCDPPERCCGNPGVCLGDQCFGNCAITCGGDAAQVDDAGSKDCDCQKHKTYAWRNYTLVEDNFDTQDCHDGCVYSVDGFPESRACFAEHVVDLTSDNAYSCFGPVGGTGGSAFSDAVYAGQGISAISMAIDNDTHWWGDDGAVTNLKITYGLMTTIQHGTNIGSDLVTCPLGSGEKITGVTVKWYKTQDPKKNYVFYLHFIIDGGSPPCQVGNLTPNGPTMSRSFNKSGCHLSYFNGRAGYIVDQLAFCFECHK